MKPSQPAVDRPTAALDAGVASEATAGLQPPCKCCDYFEPEGCPMPSPELDGGPCPGFAHDVIRVIPCTCRALAGQGLCEDCYLWTK